MYDKCSACKYGDAENLRLENQELKKQLEISEANEETYYLELRQIGECLGLNKECIVENIYQKINEIKKQLEDVDYTSVYIKGCKDTKNKYETQQKEFIEYLNKQIDHLNKLINSGSPKPYGEELRLYENSLLRYQEILSKHQEIIGGKDES